MAAAHGVLMPDRSTHAFRYGPQVIAGAGIAGRLAGHIESGPVLFVTDAMLRGIGLADSVLTAMTDAEHEVVVFDQVEADPSDTTVLAAVAAGREIGAQCVIGLGGGSPMDVAKLAAYLIPSGDTLDAIYGVNNARGKGLPLLLIPTTAGTGSEATPVAIVTTGGAEKKGVNAPALYADFAVLDPVLTLGLPASVTAATGIDAMVHAIEAYTSVRLKNPFSDLFARQALLLLSAHIRQACRDGTDVAAREAMLLGSHYAGIAFANAPVGGVHALAYPLGGIFHVPHGLSNALMLPHVLRHNLAAAIPLYAELGLLLQPDLAIAGHQAQAAALFDDIAGIIADCGVPTRLRDVGVGISDLDTLASEALKQQRLLVNNPCPITGEDARRLYEAAW
jgi:alcohol dehydrogenase class IV